MTDPMTPSDDDRRKEWARLLGRPEPVTEPRALELLRNNLAYTAIIAADALVEHARHCYALWQRGETYKPDTKLADDYVDALASLDMCWRSYVRQTQRGASAIVSETLESYAGPDIATLVETGLDRYRRIALPGYAASEDAARERAAAPRPEEG